MATQKHDYIIYHPKKIDNSENDDKQLAIITLGKRIGETQFGSPQNFVSALMKINGIDTINPCGVYSLQIIIANTFDYDEVLSEIRQVLEQAMSGIIIPLNKNVAKIQV